MPEKKTTWARLQIFVIAAVFFGPLAVATWMYYSGSLTPEGRVNAGALLEPIVNVVETLPGSQTAQAADGHWALVYVNEGDCDEACRDGLYTTRQSRLMLGREMERVVRVFLHGNSAPDTVFLENEHAGLITAQDGSFSELLKNKKPARLEEGGYFLMDPLGNLVMYFEPTMNPRDMVDDIKRLLRLSRIG
ncbi:MAG: hypothetical protein AAFN50_00585 [Pseudomonadota bacterium]